METTSRQQLLQKFDFLGSCPSVQNILRTLARFMICPVVSEFGEDAFLRACLKTGRCPLDRIAGTSYVLADPSRSRRELLLLLIFENKFLEFRDVDVVSFPSA